MKQTIEHELEEKEDIEELYKKYNLSKEEHIKIGNSINKIMLLEKKPVENPIAIIDIAPPGSGKTILNGMGLKEFINDNAVIINSDELKAFHPKIDEIAKLYPKYYTKITNNESNPWTDSLFNEAVSNNYNIIFEGTGRNFKLLKNMIDKMSNYKITVRGMAVNELNCLMSIIERYEGQKTIKGYGRLVTKEHFYKAYEEMLDTIERIEGLKSVDSVQIYIRGEEKLNPRRIYSSNIREFINAKEAVIEGRKIDKKKAYEYIETYFKINYLNFNYLNEETEIIEKVNELYNKSKEDFKRDKVFKINKKCETNTHKNS